MKDFSASLLMVSVILVGCNHLTNTCNKPYSFVINGKIEILAPDLMVTMLRYETGLGLVPVDSVIVQPDHTYQMHATMDVPGKCYLKCENQMVLFWGESEDVTVDFKGKETAPKSPMESTSYIPIYGGRNNELIDRMRRDNSIISLMESAWLSSLLQLTDTATYQQLLKETVIPKARETRKLFSDQLLKEYADCNSVVVPLSSYYGEDFDKAVLFLREKNPDNRVLKQYLAQREAEIARVEIGVDAPSFGYNNVKGKQIDLTDYRGKLLVVDFWASWCGPCRNEIQNLKTVYQNFHDKGVEFLSVSIDVNKREWIRAVEEENMSWEQVMTNDVGKKVMHDYQFNIIPFIILLDEQGKIIGLNLRGNELFEVINEQLNK